MSEAILVQGTLIEVGMGTSPETYVPVAEAREFDGPGGEAPEIDVTHMQSTAREYKLGLADPGDMTFTLNLVQADTGQGRLITLHNSRATGNFRLTFSNGQTRTFQAAVRRWREAGARDDVIQVGVTLRVTGSITRT